MSLSLKKLAVLGSEGEVASLHPGKGDMYLSLSEHVRRGPLFMTKRVWHELHLTSEARKGMNSPE